MLRPWLWGLLASTLIFSSLLVLPKKILHYDREDKRTDLVLPIDHYRSTLAQILAGAVVFAGLYFTARNVFAAEQTRWTRTFSDAIGQLGSVASSGNANIPIRVGAIYSLERLCRDSPADAPAVCHVLLQYVQSEAATPREGSVLDCEAALLALCSIAERPLENDAQWLLADIFLPGLRILNKRMASLHFRSGMLAGSRFDGSRSTRLQMEHCDLTGCSFVGSKIRNAMFSACEGMGVNFSASKADWTRFLSCTLQEGDFTYARLRYVKFFDTDLSGSDFSHADMRFVVASKANMKGVRFESADLGNADLRGASGIVPADIRAARVHPPKALLPTEWRSLYGVEFVDKWS